MKCVRGAARPALAAAVVLMLTAMTGCGAPPGSDLPIPSTSSSVTAASAAAPAARASTASVSPPSSAASVATASTPTAGASASTVPAATPTARASATTPTASPAPATLDLVLKGTGIGALRFGMARADALAQLTQALGKPSVSSTDKATWAKQQLTVYFTSGRFSSWSIERFGAGLGHDWSVPLWYKEASFRATHPTTKLSQTCPGDDALYAKVAPGVTYIWENVATGTPTENRTVWGGPVLELNC